MDGAKCPACFGSGVGQYIFHGVERNGEACIEPVRCESCGGFGWAESGESNGSDEVSKATDVYPQRSGHRMVSCNLEDADLLQRQHTRQPMNTDDYYIQEIQRLTADRDFWLRSEEKHRAKVAELESTIRRFEEERKISDKWMRCVPVAVRGIELYAEMDEDTGDLLGLYSKPGQNIEHMLTSADMDRVACHLNDVFEENNRD